MAAASLLLYLLKANGALLLVAAAYFGLLRRLTFFQLNRAYLLLGLLFAAVYPALPMPALLPAEDTPAVAFAVVEATGAAGAAMAPAAPPINWAAVGVALYAAGAAVLLARLLVQLLSLARLRRHSRPARVQGLPVRVLAGEISPFSFGRSIYLNPDLHPGPELAAVLRHELVHVRQRHTLDVLLAQLALAAAWCNPAAWLLRRALLDNLEFLADQAVLETGLDRRAYQYSLLRLSQAPAGPALVSSFTFPTLKNRVVMMNMPLSSSGQLARYFVAGPLVLAVALGISGARAQGAGPVVPVAQVASAPVHQPSAAGQPQPVASEPGSNGLRPALPSNAGKQLVITPAPAHMPLSAPAPDTKPAPPTAGTAPVSGKPNPVIYLDGQRYTGDINSISPQTIANISIFKGEDARRQFGAGAADGVIVITTTARQNDADVRAFNERTGAGVEKPAAPAAAPASVPYLAAPALAYITQHYPAARLLGVREVPGPDGGPARQQAEIVIGRRPAYLLFDAAGQFISESTGRDSR